MLSDTERNVLQLLLTKVKTSFLKHKKSLCIFSFRTMSRHSGTNLGFETCQWQSFGRKTQQASSLWNRWFLSQQQNGRIFTIFTPVRCFTLECTAPRFGQLFPTRTISEKKKRQNQRRRRQKDNHTSTNQRETTFLQKFWKWKKRWNHHCCLARKEFSKTGSVWISLVRGQDVGAVKL